MIEFNELLADESIDPSVLTASFGGRQIPGRLVRSGDGKRLTLFYDEMLPSNARVRVKLDGDLLFDDLGNAIDANGDGFPGGTRIIDFDTITLATVTDTIVRGRVFASELQPNLIGEMTLNTPLENVTIRVVGDEMGEFTATTDSMGFFEMDPAPAGRFFVAVDGATQSTMPLEGDAYYRLSPSRSRPCPAGPWISVTSSCRS